MESGLNLLSSIFLIVSIIGLWKVFEKGGEKGWKALIPFYNAVVLAHICGLSALKLFGLLILFIILAVIPFVGPLISLCGTIWVLYYFSNAFAKSFGKGTGFTIATMFFAAITYCIIGFGSAEYVGTNYKDKVA